MLQLYRGLVALSAKIHVSLFSSWITSRLGGAANAPPAFTSRTTDSSPKVPNHSIFQSFIHLWLTNDPFRQFSHHVPNVTYKRWKLRYPPFREREIFKSSVFYSQHINICIQTKIPAKLAHNKLVCNDHYRLDLLVTHDSQSSQHSLHLVLKLSRPCIR